MRQVHKLKSEDQKRAERYKIRYLQSLSLTRFIIRFIMSTATAVSSFTQPSPKFSLQEAKNASNNANNSTMPCYKLSSGYDMPVVAYGTFRSKPGGEIKKAILEAIKIGYRHFDLAHIYGNEAEIGQALQQAISDGLVKRSDLFLSSKLWNTDHEPHIVPQALEYTMKNLQVDYLDLYLIHFPVAWKYDGHNPTWGKCELGDTPLIDTWRAMEQLVDNGKVRSIGVSNYPLVLMHDLMTQARIQPVCNQIEVHAYYTRESLVNYCLSRDICVTAHTPLGGGLVNKETWQMATPMESETIQVIAVKHNVSPVQVLLRYLLQRGIVVLPKSIHVTRMAQNMALFDFFITEDEMNQISNLNRYVSYKTNPNPMSGFIGGADSFTEQGTDIFD